MTQHIADMGRTELGNDTVSSLYMWAGRTVALYSDKDFPRKPRPGARQAAGAGVRVTV